MVKTSVSTRVWSVVLAAALTCTMVPAEGIAYADESTNSETTAQTADIEAPAEGVEGESVEAAPEQSTEPVDAAAVERVSEDAVLEQPKAQAEEAATDGTAVAESDIEITRTSVNLAEEAATVFGYNGLVYQVNNDDPDTVALVDWTGTAPEGDLQIPTEAIAAGKVYSVTRINCAGGGSLK